GRVGLRGLRGSHDAADKKARPRLDDLLPGRSRRRVGGGGAAPRRPGDRAPAQPRGHGRRVRARPLPAGGGGPMGRPGSRVGTRVQARRRVGVGAGLGTGEPGHRVVERPTRFLSSYLLSASERRLAMASSILWAMLGTSSMAAENSRWPITSRSMSVSAVTVALRGRRDSSESSPKYWPPLRVAILRPRRLTVA